MAWTTPMTIVAGVTHTAAQLNALIRDNLAYLKDRTQSGSSSIVTVAAGTASVVVTFPVAFSSAPRVVAFPITSSPNLLQMSVSSGVSATTCTINMYRASGSGSVSFYWIASLG